jgi:hypothetical protein
MRWNMPAELGEIGKISGRFALICRFYANFPFSCGQPAFTHKIAAKNPISVSFGATIRPDFTTNKDQLRRISSQNGAFALVLP